MGETQSLPFSSETVSICPMWGFTSVAGVRRLGIGAPRGAALWKLHLRNPHISVDTDRIRRVLFPFALKRVGL
jgi:hypothetical protein